MRKSRIVLFLFLFSMTGSIIAQKKGDFIVKEQLIFDPQHEHSHGSSIVILPNGDILAAWFQGSGERKADDVRILGSRLKKGSKNWESPFLMAVTRDIPDCNPVLFLNSESKLFLVWVAVQANRWEFSILKYRTSTNYNNSGAPVWEWQDNILLKPGNEFAGEVAAKFRDLPEHHAGWAEYAPAYDGMIIEAARDPKKRSIGWMTRIKPLVLESGKILLPLYSDGYNFSLIAISDDKGDTWRPSLPIVGRGPIQPALIQNQNGDITAFMRDSGDPPARVHTSISIDQGETWSATIKTDIPNEASVEVLRLADGKWAFLGNDIDDGRYRVSLYLSDDEGQTWKWKVRLEDDPKDGGSYSYPSLLQDEKGLLHISYSYRTSETQKSIKYVVVDPKKITR